MKKQYKYLSVLLMLFAGFVSCDTDDEAELPTTDVEGYVYLSNRSLSTLDQNEELELKLFSNDGVQVQSISIEDADGNVIATPTISGDLATFNSSTLGDLTKSKTVRVISTLSNGKVVRDYATISVYNPVELSEDNPASVSLDSLATTTLAYSVSTFNASVDNVELFLKKNSAGTYMDTNLDLSTETDTVVLKNTNYESLNLAVNDTLYYKFAASSGTLTKAAEGNIVIE